MFFIVLYVNETVFFIHASMILLTNRLYVQFYIHDNIIIVFRGHLDKVTMYQYFLLIEMYCVYVNQRIYTSISPSKCVAETNICTQTFFVPPPSTRGATVHDELWPHLGFLGAGPDPVTSVLNF
jgi:hypothetical protein